MTNRIAWLINLLEERFGHKFELRSRSPEAIFLSLSAEVETIEFRIKNTKLKIGCSEAPCPHWDPAVEGWAPSKLGLLPAPGYIPSTEKLIQRTASGFCLHYDILTLAWWMLSRAEEVGREDLDDHGRFPATASHAYKNNYLDRPIIDEWLEILTQVIKRLWPSLSIKQHQPAISVSHDVDTPSFYGFVRFDRLVRNMVGDVFKRKDLKTFFVRPMVAFGMADELHAADPANTFDWLMTASEKRGIKSAFYFICDQTDKTKDARYTLGHTAIRRLMRNIHQRGHEIGLHPSYNTYRSPDRIALEASRLRAACSEEGIEQAEWGGRMHYLRWEHPTTLHGWEQAGMTYDSTLGYADRPGFRCGTCTEYQAFDPVTDRALKLRIRPLIAMECSVISDSYLGLGISEEAFKKFAQLKSACRAVKGTFNLLWHNSELTSVDQRDLYERVLDAQ